MVTVTGTNPGTAFLIDCDPCTPCTAGVVLAYSGEGSPSFGGTNLLMFEENEEGVAAGAIIFTTCNSETLGSLRGRVGASGPTARADLYCTCVNQ